VAHWLYWSDGIIYGPRFEFEAVAALSLLTARGMMLLARGDGSLPAEEADEPLTVLDRRPNLTAMVAVAPAPAGRPAPPVVAALPMPNGKAVHHAVEPHAEPDEGEAVAERASAGERGADEAPSATREDERARELQPIAGGSDEPEEAVLPVVRPGISSVPAVAVLVLALCAIDLVGYVPQLVLAYRDYNGISPAGLQAVAAGLNANDEAGQQPAVVFVSSDWPDWQSYGEVFLANGPFLSGNVIYARDLGETENWRLEMRYPDSRWWLLKNGQLTEIRR
jgi:hypothetical protein